MYQKKTKNHRDHSGRHVETALSAVSTVGIVLAMYRDDCPAGFAGTIMTLVIFIGSLAVFEFIFAVSDDVLGSAASGLQLGFAGGFFVLSIGIYEEAPWMTIAGILVWIGTIVYEFYTRREKFKVVMDHFLHDTREDHQ